MLKRVLIIILLLSGYSTYACMSPIKEDEENLQACLDEGYAGSDYAQFMLGLIYYYGDITDRDYLKSVEWFTKAAEQDFVFAQYNLYVLLSSGDQVPRNIPLALQWLNRAADQDYEVAQFSLAQRFENGDGLDQSFGKAFEWYMKAAEQGHPGAQNNLGVMYDAGIGVIKNKKYSLIKSCFFAYKSKSTV